MAFSETSQPEVTPFETDQNKEKALFLPQLNERLSRAQERTQRFQEDIQTSEREIGETEARI